MIFSELYGAYYRAVAEIIKTALDHPLQKDEMRRLVERYAFHESILYIEPAMTEEKWQLIRQDGTTPIKVPPTMPLTLLQKQWLKAISLDPRIRLFQDESMEFEDVAPLFTPEDIYIFDKYLDGDNYTDETYRKNFRMILDAIKNQYPLMIDTANRKGEATHRVMLPQYLEYSEKDDKFRVHGLGRRFGETVNLGRILKCERYTEKLRTMSSQLFFHDKDSSFL